MAQALTISIPEDMRNALTEISREQKVPVNELVKDSLRKFIATQRFRKLRKTVLPFAEAEGILTDEDVFKHIS